MAGFSPYLDPGVHWAGNGFQRVGGDGQGALRFAATRSSSGNWLGQLGHLAMLMAMRMDYRRYKHPAVVFSAAGSYHSAADQGVLPRSRPQHPSLDSLEGFSFQPSELAKAALILFLAYFLESRTKSMKTGGTHCCPQLCPRWCFWL